MGIMKWDMKLNPHKAKFIQVQKSMMQGLNYHSALDVVALSLKVCSVGVLDAELFLNSQVRPWLGEPLHSFD